MGVNSKRKGVIMGNENEPIIKQLYTQNNVMGSDDSFTVSPVRQQSSQRAKRQSYPSILLFNTDSFF